MKAPAMMPTTIEEAVRQLAPKDELERSARDGNTTEDERAELDELERTQLRDLTDKQQARADALKFKAQSTSHLSKGDMAKLGKRKVRVIWAVLACCQRAGVPEDHQARFKTWLQDVKARNGIQKDARARADRAVRTPSNSPDFGPSRRSDAEKCLLYGLLALAAKTPGEAASYALSVAKSAMRVQLDNSHKAGAPMKPEGAVQQLLGVLSQASVQI